MSPPGKPTIRSCRSSGNETFTCWWKPDSDGGLPTNYTLLYSIEGGEKAYECPDYITGGPSSCYFDKSLTRLWTTYKIIVKATNDMGSNISDPHYVDLKTLVKLGPPMDLSLEAKQLREIMYVWARWSPPPLVNDGTSWQTCYYELRLKPGGGKEWEIHFVGEQTQYQIFQLRPAVKYTIQVRCITDHGERSEWSPEGYIQLPSGQPPGKPELIRCRSPEKETFTCWWKPSSDGGLPSNYTLFYNKEGDETYYECPDYTTAGPNSCYFDKKHTSLWVTYNFTIKATNENGSDVSQPYYVDVANIVQPDPPENLSLEFEKKVYGQYLLLNWSPPSRGDVRSGWLTLEYELHIKPEEGQEWEKIFVGQRTTYKMFSVNPGERYVAKIRCRSDHGTWSDWSPESNIKLRKEFRVKDMLVWIFVAFLSFVICLIMIWMLALKKINMMARILPPVPGPKIKGFDAQLLEAGKPEELLSALECQGFPPTPDYENLLEEFLEIDDSEDQQLMPSNEKSYPNKNMKLAHQETDSDSGRGSCESPSLLSEKRKEAKNPLLVSKIPDTNEMQRDTQRSSLQETPRGDTEGQHPLVSNGGPRSSTWPGFQLSYCQTSKGSYYDTVGGCKMAFSAMNVHRSPIVMGREEGKCRSQHPKHIETICEGKPAKLEDAANLPLNTQHEREGVWLLPPARSPFLPTKQMDYVEVHKVNHDGALAVLPKQKETVDKTERCLVPGNTNEYTKVSTVVSNHILVLFPDPKVEALPFFQEPPKEPTQDSQQSQREINLSYCLTAPSTCKIQTGGLDYMDPNNFMCRFN
ncbi:prolactin receptor isoform X2 [Rhineura floridana]|uniref:prolactin receptor isoform X2 n=1 Tax=Rhineura floridana TaxID=261503 RepID=UPI002AC80480|nr:prolactin receptor isoform X2 [Rhineura floridana]